MIEAELFDGTVLEFPDGTAPEVIQRKVKELTAARRGGAAAPVIPQTPPPKVPNFVGVPLEQRAPPAPSPEGNPFLDAIMGGATDALGIADQGMRGIAKGFTNIVGLPQSLAAASNTLGAAGLDAVGIPDADLIARIMNPMAAVMEMGPNSADLQGRLDTANNITADSLGVERPRAAPEGLLERGANRIGEELGASGVPVGGALSAAAKVGVEGARKLPGVLRHMVESAAVNPGKFAGKEVAVSTGAGLGATAANETFGEGPWSDMLGAIFGAGTVGLGGTMARSGRDILGALFQKPTFVDQVVKDAVVDRIGNSAGLPGSESAGGVIDVDPLVRAIMDENRSTPSKVIPGYQESLADRTGNAGIAALEYGRQQGPTAGSYLTRRSKNTEAVENAMQRLEPEAPPAALREELAVERDRRLGDVSVQRQNADDEINRVVMGLQPQTTPGQRGNTIRTALEEARDAARARTDDAYTAADVNENRVDPAGLTTALDNAVAELTTVERGLIPQGTIDQVAALGRAAEDGATPPAVRLKEATDLRSELQRLQRAALADPKAEKGGRNAARVLGQMVDTVEGFIQRSVTPEQSDALTAARGTKFDEAERFGRQGDPVAEAVARREGGQPKLRDDQVASRFVNPQAMRRLFAEADTPATRTAIRDEVLSRGDTTSADRINRFLDQYGEQVDQFPGLRAEFERAAAARTQQGDVTAREAAMQRELGTDDTPGRGTVGKYLQFSDANPERAIGEVLAAKDPGKAADELLTFINDKPQAVEGARAAFWKKLRSESQSVDATTRSMSGGRAWRGDWLKGWLDTPATAAVAERLYRDNPEHLERIREIAAVLDNTDLRVRGKASASSGTSQGVSNILTPETLQSRFIAYSRGQLGGTYLATSIAATVARRAVRGARTDAIERMTDQALLDPEFAAALLKENNPANRAALARRAKGWLANEGATFLEIMNGEDDEVKNKVMEDG